MSFRIADAVKAPLGDGVRLYGGPGLRRVELERVDSDTAGEVTDLRFRVRRDWRVPRPRRRASGR